MFYAEKNKGLWAKIQSKQGQISVGTRNNFQHIFVVFACC